MEWFSVDKRGLGKLLERKGKQFILNELVQNAWDEKTTRVDITLRKPPKARLYQLTVQDDNPTGFSNLAYAFTLFAESEKKGNAEKRGRFNLGEKLVLALCERATILSTKGTIMFNEDGRHELKAKSKTGTVFTAELSLTAAEAEEFEAAAFRLIPPPGIDTYFNGALIPVRQVRARQSGVSLPTEIGDAEGILRPTTRKTTVTVIEPGAGETAMLYEMGIPVVETDGRWHIDIGQKVPLNMDRDNVTPSYLGRVRAVVAELMEKELTAEDANATWVKDALQRHGDTASEELIQKIATVRFGEKRVAYDPNDPEANNLAVAAGYTVVHGGAMSRQEWDAMKRVGAILPSSLVTPSPKPFKPGGEPLKFLLPEAQTNGMKAFVGYAYRIGVELMDAEVGVEIANDPGWQFLAAYGPANNGRAGRLVVNAAKLGKKWFDGCLTGQMAAINDLLIHEYGHHYESNHLSERYLDALSNLGGKMTQLALEKPELFRASLNHLVEVA